MLLLFLHAGRKKTFQNHRPVSTWKSFCCRPLLPSTSSLICQGFSAHSGFSYNSAQTVGEWAQNGTAAAAPEDRRTDGHADSVHPGSIRWRHRQQLVQDLEKKRRGTQCCAAKVLSCCASVQGSGVPGKAEQNQEEHLGSQQTRRAAVDYAVYVHGL